jgi:hypothetical protein
MTLADTWLRSPTTALQGYGSTVYTALFAAYGAYHRQVRTRPTPAALDPERVLTVRWTGSDWRPGRSRRQRRGPSCALGPGAYGALL